VLASDAGGSGEDERFRLVQRVRPRASTRSCRSASRARYAPSDRTPFSRRAPRKLRS
jgi:hypothetical protein